MNRRRFHHAIALIGGACWLIFTPGLWAAPSALIVIGLTGDPAISTEFAGVAQNIREGLIQRGFAPDAVEVLGAQPSDGLVTTDRILASLKKRQTLTATDEFWVILLGFSGHSEGDIPAFQVYGPRLTATQLKSALDSIPATQFVFIGTSASGAFVPLLLAPHRSVLTATKDDGEVELPRFPAAWAAALKEKPTAEWKELAARAATLTIKVYLDGNLSESEHAQLGDPATGRVLDAPFGVTPPVP